MKSVTLLVVAGFLLGGPVWAATPDGAGNAAGDPAAQAQRINEELAQLAAETPVALEVAALEAKQREAQQQHSAERQEIQRQIGEMKNRPEWKEYEQRIAPLQRELQAQGRTEVEALAAAGRELFETRHAALRQRGRADLVEGRALGLDVLTYPRVDGSTSTHPLSVIVASRLLEVPYGWEYTAARGGYRVALSSEDFGTLRRGAPPALPLDPTAPAIRPVGRFANLELNLAASRVYAQAGEDADAVQQRTARMINSLLANHTDTHRAHVNLINGHADLILVARGPSESELKLAEEHGVTLVATPIARDALVFIVNRANDLESLTQQQLRDIYKGKIARWEEVGASIAPPEGRSAPARLQIIRPLRRQRDSGSRELFDELLMKGEQLPEPRNQHELSMYQVLSMAGPYNRITTEPETLGYSVYYYEQFMSMSPHTRTIAVGGVEPNAQTIASGEYPFVADVYAVHREGEPAGSPAMRLLAWLMSDEGQAVVAESGYVPVRRD